MKLALTAPVISRSIRLDCRRRIHAVALLGPVRSLAVHRSC
jgi:hypothetical protein